MATNSEIAARLGLTHSSVSRMRAGKRIGSLSVLVRIADEYDTTLDELVAAATAAKENGEPTEWVSLLARIFGDEEKDPLPESAAVAVE